MRWCAHPLGTADACTAPELTPRYPATAAADAMLADAASSTTAVCPEASHPLHTPKESTVPLQHDPDASKTPYAEPQAFRGHCMSVNRAHSCGFARWTLSSSISNAHIALSKQTYSTVKLPCRVGLEGQCQWPGHRRCLMRRSRHWGSTACCCQSPRSKCRLRSARLCSRRPGCREPCCSLRAPGSMHPACRALPLTINAIPSPHCSLLLNLLFYISLQSAVLLIGSFEKIHGVDTDWSTCQPELQMHCEEDLLKMPFSEHNAPFSTPS